MINKKLIKYEFLPEIYCKVTASGLWLKGNTPFKEWEKIGSHLKKIGGAVQLWLGDWINFGEKAYGEKYSQATEGTHYELQTLQGYSSIAKRTENTRKKLGSNPTLLLGAHWDLIADRPEAEQEKWVKKTTDNNWTIKELREAIKESKKVDTPELPEGKCNHKCPVHCI